MNPPETVLVIYNIHRQLGLRISHSLPIMLFIMRDFDIRTGLRKKLLDDHQHEPGTLIVDEFVLQLHYARADIAVINGQLNGYEIKSGRDTLLRLPNQQEIYSQIFDRVTAVVEECHVEDVVDIVPDWWGILVASNVCGEIQFTETRPAKQNSNACALSLAQLLWKNEAITVLRSIGITRGLSSKPKSVLWQRLAESFGWPELSAKVRECIKARQDWRSDLLRT